MKLQNPQTRSLNKLLALVSCCATSCFAPTYLERNASRDSSDSAATLEPDASQASSGSAVILEQDALQTPSDSAATLTSVQPKQPATKPAPVKNTPARQDPEKEKLAREFLKTYDFNKLGGWMPVLGKCAPLCTTCNIECGPCCPTGCIGCLLCNYCGIPRSTGCMYRYDKRCRKNCIIAQLLCGPIERHKEIPCCYICCDSIRMCIDLTCLWEGKNLTAYDIARIVKLAEQAPEMQEMTEQAPGMQEMTGTANTNPLTLARF